MKNQNFKTKEINSRGITLVALIITIIVLLILAMVSIRLVMNGGIIGKSQKATSDYTIAEEKEQIKLGHKEYQMAKFVEENPTLKVEGATVTGDETSIWTITFGKTNNQYTLSKDGIITDFTNSTTTASDFNATEWDQTASSDDWFIWDKNDSSIIIGYNTDKLNEIQGTVQLRIPSKCRGICQNLEMIFGDIINELIAKIQNNEITEAEAEEQFYNLQMSIIANNAKISQIEIPGSLTVIGDSAFSYTGITSISIPNSVINMEETAFEGCANLESATVNCSTIVENAFGGCTSLNSVILGNNVRSIGERAFNQTAITSIVIPDGVTSLDERVFDGCNELTNITIGNGITGSNRILYYCNNVETLNLNCESVILPNLAKLKKITIGDSVKNVRIEDSPNIIEAVINCETIPERLFYTFNSKLETVKIGNSVKNIENYAFYECSNLSNITIGNNLENIGEGAFAGCTSLTNVKMSDSVKIIGDFAFSDCTSLTNIELGNNVERIGKCAFRYDTSVNSIIIPQTVTYIDEYAFMNWNSSQIINIKVQSTGEWSNKWSNKWSNNCNARIYYSSDNNTYDNNTGGDGNSAVK